MQKEKHSNNKCDDTTKIIAQTNYKVSNVAYSVATEDVNFTEPTLTWLPDSISHKNKEPISLQELERRVNTYKNQSTKGEKINNSGFLKGLYSGYFVGANCTKSVPYLCYDIDVKNSDKPEENKHLMNFAKNERVFEELEKVSVLCWRSNSGYGIAGILYVPQIAQYTSKTSIKHLKVGKSITAYLSDYLHKTTGIKRVIFDEAQSIFRQVRLVADQRGAVRNLNATPFVFSYTSEEVTKKTITGVTNYRYSDYRLPENSIYSQFNSDNNITDVLRNNRFSIGASSGGKTRVKHSSSASISSGFIDEANNVYVNFSNSFDSTGKVRFTPSHIVCKNEFGNNWKEFRSYLYTQGYEDKPIGGNEVKRTGVLLKDALRGVTDEKKTSEIIFKHCFNFKYASNQVKRQFITDNCTRPEFRKHFVTHLNFVDYKIP
ncbi:MAG: hypothetical protein GX921_06045, partial [Bacteroidales bacterium]|nr:hypothetical protein [Bacteroidales bacterium]